MDEPNLNSTFLPNANAVPGSPSAQLNSQTAANRKVHYEKVHPNELQKNHPFLNWIRLLDQMEQVSGNKVNQILVESNEHLVQVGQLIERHSRRAVENYLCWATVARFLPYLGSHFRRLYADFRQKVPDLSQNNNAPLEFSSFQSKLLSKQKQHGFGMQKSNLFGLKASGSSSGRLFLSRWKECVHLTTEGLKSASAVLYVQQRQSMVESVSLHVANLVQKLQNAFEQIIDSQPWIESQTVRDQIKQRAQSIGSRIALPVGLLQSADNALDELKIEVHAVFMANIVAMLRHEMSSELKRLNQTPDSERDWLMEPLVPNAYYDSLNHFISK